MSRHILEPLTESQREAVTHIEGPLLVVAGPGSGKTRVITHRIAYLLDQGVPPQHILGITFTNKAANEMAERVARLIPGHGVWLGTFHKFCVRILRHYGERIGLSPDFVIYDTRDRQDLIRAVLEELKIDRDSLDPRRVEAIISRAKNDYCTPEKFARRENDPWLVRVYRRYQERLHELNALDFDDLLLQAARLLSEDEAVRATLDQHFQYILVDEYQDTNEVQYHIVRLLSRDIRNLCVTGDPDQSIYGWRGANIRNILQFEKDYPDCRVVRLEENFRSTASILEVADRLIAHNTLRKEKRLRSMKPGGVPVRLRAYGTGEEEAAAIAEDIREQVAGGQRDYSDFAIFCRISALTRTLEAALRRYGIPYQILSGVGFYERSEIKDIFAYLRLLVNPRDDISFARAVKVPPRGVGDTTLKKLAALARKHRVGMFEAIPLLLDTGQAKGKAARGLHEFFTKVNTWRKSIDGPVRELLERILMETGYAEWVKETDRGQERYENIQELITAAQQFDDSAEGGGLVQFVAETALATDLDRWDPDQPAVSVMTLHAAKGLEFPVVYIYALEDGILPHSRSSDSQEELEEERRLLFVGITRAQEELNLSYARMRAFRGSYTPTRASRFLPELGVPVDAVDDYEEPWTWSGAPAIRELPPLPAVAGAPGRRRSGSGNNGSTSTNQRFREGMEVVHPRYGRGRVTQVVGSGELVKVTVRFRQSGTRSFIASKAPLRPA